MEYKKYSIEDFELAKSFVSRCNRSNFSLHRLGQETAVFAYNEEQELLAIAMQWRNELHNKTIVVELCVLPEHRRKGLGTKSFNKLLEFFPPRDNDFAFDIMCKSDDIESQKFAKSLGFELYLKGYNNIFSVDDFIIEDGNCDFVKLSKYCESAENKEKVRKFHCSMYDRDHEPFLPLNKDKELRYDYYSEGDIEYGVVLLNGNRIVGCSLAYLNFENRLNTRFEDVTCLHGYAEGKDVKEEAFLIQALYSYQIKLLKENARKNVYIEFDSIEATSELMLSWLPYTKKPLLRFHKKL